MVGTVAQMHLLPVPPFNATMVPRGRQPRFENSEIVRVISANSETGAIEVLRAQEDTTARDIGLGWELIVTITSKLFDDVEEIVADHAARLLEIEHAIGFDTRVPLAMEPSQIIIGEITRNAAGGITSAGVKWPDGSLGTFTALVFNASHPGAIDSYEVTHDDLGITYFQDVVERDANGLVINRTQANNALAMITETNPDRVEVYNMTNGKHLATFTEGAKSVHLYRSLRTFSEQKPDFTDNFKRIITGGWGPSPAGGLWGDFNGLDSAYAVNDGATIHPAPGVSHYVRLNDVVKEYDLRTDNALTTVPVGSTNSFSAIGGWQSTTNHTRFRLTFNTNGSVVANITEIVGGVETTLGTATTVGASGSYAANQKWNIRATHDGDGNLAMYAWKQGNAEPGTPTVTAFSQTFITGKLGVRALVASSATNDPTFKISNFSAVSKWPTPPVVTHDVWVRLLDEPFAGTVDTEWLLAQLSNNAPDDVLATAMKYVTGGATPADYGPVYSTDRTFDLPHATDGTRQEGSDWNDFSGVNGSIRYTHLTVPKTDAPESHQLGSLDCSGFSRRVYGFDMGLPMCLDDEEDFDGLNIPRRATQQQTDGPGLYLIPHTGSVAPTLADVAKMIPGDLPFFDADTSNPDEEEGQIDHMGIFLGYDVNTGEPRFISSRKTISGPTFSDMGGKSTLTGTGLYARTFRAARRY
jgi:hypothetical protein